MLYAFFWVISRRGITQKKAYNEFYLLQNAGTGYKVHSPCCSVGVLEWDGRSQYLCGMHPDLAIRPVFKYTNPNRNPSKFGFFFGGKNVQILCEAGNLIPKLHNTANSCRRHGPFTAWFRSARPGNVITRSKNIYFIGGRNTLSIAMKLRVKSSQRRENVWSSVHCASPLTSLPLHPRARRDQVIWRTQFSLGRITNGLTDKKLR